MASSGAGSSRRIARTITHTDEVQVEDVEIEGLVLRFVRVFEWSEDPTAAQELPVEQLEFFEQTHGWTPIGTLQMQNESSLRTAVRRWCHANPVDLRDFDVT